MAKVDLDAFSLHKRLMQDSEAYRRLQEAIEPVEGPVNVYADKPPHPVKFAEGHPVHEHLETLRKHAETKKSADKLSKEAATALADNIKTTAAQAHTALDQHAKDFVQAGEDVQRALADIQKELPKAGLNPELHHQAVGKLEEETKRFVESHTDGARFVAHHQKEVKELSGIASKSEAKIKPLKLKVEKLDATGHRLPLAATTEAAEKKWKTMGKWERITESTKQAWSHGGRIKKAFRVVGTGLGTIILVAGLKDLGRFTHVVSPERDENGQEIPVDAGTLVKSIAELSGGGGLAILSLTGGGKGHALGR